MSYTYDFNVIVDRSREKAQRRPVVTPVQTLANLPRSTIRQHRLQGARACGTRVGEVDDKVSRVDPSFSILTLLVRP